MSTISTLDQQLLAELVNDLDRLGIAVTYLRAAKPSIRKAVIERKVSLELICASINQRLKSFGRLVEPSHIQAILDEAEMASEAPEKIFLASFQGRGPPTGTSPPSSQANSR